MVAIMPQKVRIEGAGQSREGLRQVKQARSNQMRKGKKVAKNKIPTIPISLLPQITIYDVSLVTQTFLS